MPELLDYTERSDLAKQTLQETLLKDGAAHFQKGMELGKQAAQNILQCVKEVRLAGLDFLEARDKQISFDEYNELWFASVKKVLPKGFTLSYMVQAARVANSLPDEPKSLAECKPAIQVTFYALGIMEEPRRIEQQTAHVRNIFVECVNAFKGIYEKIESMKADEPMAHWSRAMLLQFVENGQPVVRDVMEAERLLKIFECEYYVKPN